MHLIDASEITVEYHVNERVIRALDNVSLQLPSMGYTLGIVGESGSGKSTLGLSLLNAIERPGKIVQGRVDFQGQNVFEFDRNRLRRYLWKEVAMVYQSAMNSLNPVKKIYNPIVEVIREHEGVSQNDAYDRALKLLNDVGISAERAGSYPFEFSGGMRQRVVIALSLALSPKVLIADEPTSALDVVTQRQILALMKKSVAERGLSLVFITHEIALVGSLVEHVAVMFSGEIVEMGSVPDILLKPLHPYTEMLLSTVLTMGSSTNDVFATHGEAANAERLLVTDTMCKYSNRCKYAFDRCRKERPVLTEVEKGRWVSCFKYA